MNEGELGYSYQPLHRKQVRAKKDYICSACGKPILAGTLYISHAMIYDGDFQYQREHLINCWSEDY